MTFKTYISKTPSQVRSFCKRQIYNPLNKKERESLLKLFLVSPIQTDWAGQLSRVPGPGGEGEHLPDPLGRRRQGHRRRQGGEAGLPHSDTESPGRFQDAWGDFDSRHMRLIVWKKISWQKIFYKRAPIIIKVLPKLDQYAKRISHWVVFARRVTHYLMSSESFRQYMNSFSLNISVPCVIQ